MEQNARQSVSGGFGKEKALRLAKKILLWLIGAALVFISVFPFLWVVISSLKPLSEIESIRFHFFPIRWTGENYEQLFAGKSVYFPRGASFALSIGMTLLVSLTALALLFAVYRIRSTPFYILDEVEAALDDSNLRRLAAYIDSLCHTTQLIMITHQRRTMEMADVLFGVSMQADGVTKVVSQKLDRALEYAE